MNVQQRSSPHRKIAVANILPNPHRDMQGNPVTDEKIDALIESFARNGFWENIIVRQHPTREGKYQLAYGHGRLAALKKAKYIEVTLPVAKLSDWEMYLAMVDENETQATITPQIVFENVGVGAGLIEQYAKASKTSEEFAAKFGLTAAGVGKSDFSTPDSFGRIKARIERGEGPGRDVILSLIPSAKLHGMVVTEVLNSLYGVARERAKQHQAEAKQAEAEAARKKAAAEKDADRAATLRAKAKAADAEADKLLTEAKKVAKLGIDANVLLLLPSPAHMVELGQEVRRLGIAKEYHLPLAKLIRDEDWSKRDVRRRVEAWYDIQSGAHAKRLESNEKEKARERMQKAIAGGDLDAFLIKLGGKLYDLQRDLRLAADYANFAGKGTRNEIVRKWPALRDLIQTTIDRAGTVESVQHLQPETKMLTHRP